jgi:putative ABC transport system permease protein
MRPADLRQALRSLRRRPAFALAAILTLALGVGANTAVYQVIYTVLLRPLPFREPQKLLQVWESTPVLPQLQVAVPDFEDWRKDTHSFAQMAAYTFQAINRITLLGQGEPEVVQATNVTRNLFSTVGIKPVLGRGFSAAEEREKRAVALIGEKLWRRKFGADPAIVGKTIRLETESFTVIGVVPSRQAFPEWADLWIPFSWVEPELLTTRKYHPLEVIARLKPGVGEEQAQAEMRMLAARLATQHADTNGTVGAYVIPLSRQITGEVRPALLLVWAAVGLVLLMACANLAHMVLARMLDRRQELAIRASLGAGRGRLVQLVVTESLLLALMGGAVGAALALAASRVLRTLAESQIPRMEWQAFQAPVWLFVAVVSISCGVLFALPACAQACGVEARPASGRSMSRPRSPVSSILMAAEIAMAFVVLMGAALLVRSFVGLLSEDPGFRSKGVLAMEIPLPSSRYDSDKVGRFLNTQVLPAVRALPGVRDVAATNCAPMSLAPTEQMRFATRFGIVGRTFEPGRYPVAQLRWVTPDYFRVLGIPLRRGRWLTEADEEKPRYLINEALARRFFPREDPTAKRLIMGVVDRHQDLIEIAGVVGDVRDMSLDEAAAPTLYLISSSPRMTLLIESAGDPMGLVAPIREAIHRADSEIAVTAAAPLDRYVADSLAHRRFALTLLAAFGTLAAFLTAAGIYGLLAYTLSGRVREFGIRAALGASPVSLVKMMMREGAAIAIPGLAAGVALSLAFARLVKSLLYRLSPTDPLSLAAVGLFVSAIVLLSVWLPARRAARVDPSAALRVQY